AGVHVVAGQRPDRALVLARQGPVLAAPHRFHLAGALGPAAGSRLLAGGLLVRGRGDGLPAPALGLAAPGSRPALARRHASPLGPSPTGNILGLTRALRFLIDHLGGVG